MDAKKEIEKMAKIIEKRVDTNLGQVNGIKVYEKYDCQITTTVSTKLIAEALYNAGYRKKRLHSKPAKQSEVNK